MLAFGSGFLLGLSLIVAIGAQNAFVLRQGLRREHVFPVVLTCALSDAVLIAAGVSGFGALMTTFPEIENIARWGGAVFLAVYGMKSLWSALKSHSALIPADGPPPSLMQTFLVVLACTWLNPHVYLDTVVLLGSVSTQYDGARTAFAAGAMTASFGFFFALGYGAALLRPLFARPAAWRLLDLVIGMTMIALAASLIARF
jgi:L-lysine exporter family protein LysE/ArgO